MATKKTDWQRRFEELAKENRKLAKRANQRLVRLERAAKKPGMKAILGYAYKTAMKDIKSTGKKGLPRFVENPKLLSINNGIKELSGESLYRANYYLLKTQNKMMREVLGSATSTIGQGLSKVGEGISKTIGVKRIWDKRNKTINEKYLSEYDLRLSDNDMKRFWESKKQAKLEKIVGSTQMFAVAAVMKKFNLMANKRNLEKFLKDNIDLTGVDPEELKAQKGEKYADYLDRVQEFAKYTDDEVLNDAINRALKNGINVNNIFI